MKELKEAWIVEGLMPERALDRLQKAGISIFKAKKIKKMQILFHISKKIFFEENRLERVGAQKDLPTYIKSIDDTISKKKEMFLNN